MKNTIKERPIIFSAPMIQAILDGRKTQTRRVMKPQPVFIAEAGIGKLIPFKTVDADPKGIIYCPYGKVGDRLWVRENFHSDIKDMEYARAKYEDAMSASPIYYQADYDKSGWVNAGFITKPSLFMPRWASRITLEITGVRVERLNQISEEDAKAEGVQHNGLKYSIEPYKNYLKEGVGYQKSIPQASYMTLWESINGIGTWNKNPLVWVLEFRRVYEI